MKISSSALSAVESTLVTDLSFKASHARLHLQPKSAPNPCKESDDHDDDSSFYANGTEDSDADSSIGAVMEMRVPSDTADEVNLVVQRDDYHCIQSAHASGYDMEKYFQPTSFLCGVENREWCSTESADALSADAAYDFATSTSLRTMKIEEDDTGTSAEENRNVPRYTPYIETQFEAICATSKRPFHFVALRSIKALKRNIVIHITIDEFGSLGLIVKDNADGVVCVVDVSPSAMKACKVLHPGDILAHLENDEKEIIPEIEVVIKNMNHAKLPTRGPLCDKLEVRASTDIALPKSTNTDKVNFLSGILAICEKINDLVAFFSLCSLAQFDNNSSDCNKPTDEPAGIPYIEPITPPDALLESASPLQNPDEAPEERLDESQEAPIEDQLQKPRTLASRVISPDDNLPSIDDEYFDGMFSSDGSYLSMEDLNATNGIIPLLKGTGPVRLADDLAEDIVSSIEAADIDAILDTVVEHLVFIFDSVIPDGEDDDDEEDDDFGLLGSPTNAKADRGLDRNAPSKLKALVNGKYSSVTKDRKGTKFLRKVRRYRLLLHKRLNRSTILCSGVNHNLGADSFDGESSDSDSDNSDFTLTEKGPGLNLSMPEFGRYAEQGVDSLQKLQKAVETLKLQNKLGLAMEGMASHVQSDSRQENGPVKPAQTSPEELAKAWRNGCERALQQMNEEETAYLTAYTAATGTSALTAVSELALLSTAVNKNTSRTYNINNSAGAIDTVAGNICDGDGGIGVLASKYVTRAQKDKERAARMEAMTRALAVERKNRTAKELSKNKKSRVRFESASDAVSSTSGASSKYSASVSIGIKKSSRARKNHKGTIV